MWYLITLLFNSFAGSFSQTLVVFSHECLEQYSAVYSWVPQCGFLDFSLCTAFYSLVLNQGNSSLLSFLLSPRSSQLRETTGLCLGSLSLCCSLETFSRISLENNNLFFFPPQWSLPFLACVQCLGAIISYILSHVLVFSGSRINLIPVTLS